MSKTISEQDFEQATLKVAHEQGWEFLDEQGRPLWLSEGRLALACTKAGYALAATPVQVEAVGAGDAVAVLADWFQEVGRLELIAAENYLHKNGQAGMAGAVDWVLRDLPPLLAAARLHSLEDGGVAGTFQARVAKWMRETFEPAVLVDFAERGHRFGEEALELLQANGTTKADLLKLVDYVYSRPVGEFPKEVGGTMVTLAALCGARGVDLMGAADAEQSRVESPEVRAKIQAKQADKRARMGHSPLPGFAAPTTGATHQEQQEGGSHA